MEGLRNLAIHLGVSLFFGLLIGKDKREKFRVFLSVAGWSAGLSLPVFFSYHSIFNSASLKMIFLAVGLSDEAFEGFRAMVIIQTLICVVACSFDVFSFFRERRAKHASATAATSETAAVPRPVGSKKGKK